MAASYMDFLCFTRACLPGSRKTDSVNDNMTLTLSRLHILVHLDVIFYHGDACLLYVIYYYSLPILVMTIFTIILLCIDNCRYDSPKFLLLSFYVCLKKNSLF